MIVMNTNLNLDCNQDADNEEDFSRHMKRDEEGPNLLMKLQVNERTRVQIFLQNFNKDSKSPTKTPKKSFNFEIAS